VDIVENHPAANQFAFVAGRLIHNFAVVEAMTYDWLHALSTDPTEAEKAKGKTLHDRIQRVVRLLGTANSFPADRKAKAERLWNQLDTKGRKLRNDTAHGALRIELPVGDLKAQPLFIGVVAFNRQTNQDEYVSLAELTDGAETTGAIVMQLRELLSGQYPNLKSPDPRFAPAGSRLSVRLAYSCAYLLDHAAIRLRRFR